MALTRWFLFERPGIILIASLRALVNLFENEPDSLFRTYFGTYAKDEYGGWTIDNSRQRLNRFCMAERISCDFENNVVQTNNGYGTHFLLILILLNIIIQFLGG